jgi:signal recognition particle subunit SRP54
LGEISSQDRDRAAEMGQDKFKRFEAIIQSMTPIERRKPGLLNASRRRRIAHGSGTHLKHVNELLKAHEKMKKMGVKLKKMQKMLLRRR